MDNKAEHALNHIRTLLDTEFLCVLSTQKNGQPYASLVAFAVTRDLMQMIFLTPNTTRKYENLSASPRVAMLVNNSRNQVKDIYNAISLTAIGTAATVAGDGKQELLHLYLNRHPHLNDFAKAPTTALVSVSVDRYFLVSRFQNVVEIGMGA